MEFEGQSIHGGIAIGKLHIFQNSQQVTCYQVEDVEQEVLRFLHAKDIAEKQLMQLRDKAMHEIGRSEATLFEAHRMILVDGRYVEKIQELIRTQKVNAEYAVAVMEGKITSAFEAMEDSYIKERSIDVKDICKRLIGVLQGNATQKAFADCKDVIVFARELTPEDTMSFDKANICSMVTTHGSVNSHTAILARVMDLPAIIGIPYDDSLNGKLAIVDGYAGKLIVEPTEQELSLYKKRQEYEIEKKRLLMEYKGKATITRDGRRIFLCANIGNVSDAKVAMDNDAEGIGLLRSEFLYMESENYPDEDTLYEAYKTVAQTCYPKQVVIRTLDVGDEKQISYFNLPIERNPALGHRGIRVSLSQREVFRTQLRAIYRASVHGELAILFPMIIDVSEIREIKNLIEEIKAELDRESVKYKECLIGAMIETPAAVMISDLIAKEVDFLSVGTNDLTQYTLAVDRENETMQSIYNPYHEAIMRMLTIVVDNGHRAGCKVGICGELASEPKLVGTLIEMGFDTISVSPASILSIRETVLKYIDKMK